MAAILAEEATAAGAGAGESISEGSTKQAGDFKKGAADNALLGGFGVNEVGKGIGSVISVINDAYEIYRTNKKLGKQERDNTLNRYRAGIVFQDKENRDQLVTENLIPAYYSSSNIKYLIRRGILPFGWNKDMAVEQGFGKEVFIHEMRLKTEENSKEFLRREEEKEKLKNSLGEIQNLKNRFKTRKLLEYYNQ